MKFILVFLILSFFSLFSKSKDIYMSTTGNDETGDGSFDNPYLSLSKCQELSESGDIVYIMGGTYTNFEIAYSTSTYNYIHYFSKSGITYKAYNSEPVIFDFEFDPKYKTKDNKITQRVTGFYIMEGAEDITFEDFSCTRIPTMTLEELVEAKASKNLTQSECFHSRGKNIRFNRIKAYSNYGIGFYFLGMNSYFIAYRCDSYNNTGIDSASYGNADGFGSHGTGGKFIECRAWDNSDDNYDCINSYKTTIFDSCWAFNINFTNKNIQDGNGFKVGGWGKSATAKNLYEEYSGDNPPVHIVKNCIATSNKANGFYSNHQPGQAAIWFNNKSYNNKANFDMTEGSETWELDSNGKVVDICGTREILYFNFAFKYNYNFKNIDETCNMYGKEANLYMANIPDENNKFNTWNFRDITLSNDDFLSIDKNELARERGEEGRLPEINFMKLNPNGPNYEILKSIEDEMKNYEILEDGTIKLINSNSDNSQKEEETESQINENKNSNEQSYSSKENSEIINNKVNIKNNNNNNEYNSNDFEEINDEVENNSQKLSPGAIVGIVLGISISIFIIILIIVILRKKNKMINEVVKSENKIIKLEDSNSLNKINK